MKPGIIIGAVAAVALIAFGIFFFDVNQTEEASLPDVDVTVEGGNMPEFDLESGEIETGTEEVTITVPTVDIESPEEDTASVAN